MMRTIDASSSRSEATRGFLGVVRTSSDGRSYVLLAGAARQIKSSSEKKMKRRRRLGGRGAGILF